MKRLLSLSLILSSSMLFSQSSFEKLKSAMVGSFNSEKQAKEDSSYFNIRLDMVEIWESTDEDFWLYVEQAVNKAEAKPYRQRVYHLEKIEEDQFQSSIYKIDSAHWFTGLKHKPELEGKLKMENISLLEGCKILLVTTNAGDEFVGQTEKGKCLNAWGKAKYATSAVLIKKDRMISWDQGWDENDIQVWGAEKGGYVFMKE